MNTFSHGVWIYYFLRKRRYVLPAVVGAVIPDLLYSIPLLYLTAQSKIATSEIVKKLFLIPFKGWDGAYSQAEIDLIHNTLTHLFTLPPVHVVRLISHSYVIWGAFMVLSWYLGRRGWLALGWGWVSHIVIDTLTHVDDAIPYFYPVWNRTIRGVVSYWNPEYHGTAFATLNYFGIILILFLLAREWWQRYRAGVKE